MRLYAHICTYIDNSYICRRLLLGSPGLLNSLPEASYVKHSRTVTRQWSRIADCEFGYEEGKKGSGRERTAQWWLQSSWSVGPCFFHWNDFETLEKLTGHEVSSKMQMQSGFRANSTKSKRRGSWLRNKVHINEEVTWSISRTGHVECESCTRDPVMSSLVWDG